MFPIVHTVLGMFPQIIRQKAFLRDERRRLRIASENLDAKRQALATMKREDWLPDSLKRVDEDRIALNIGGLVRAWVLTGNTAAVLSLLPLIRRCSRRRKLFCCVTLDLF